ncbi:hypothetical protein D1614_23020 [Maribellus luteus]|uniref:DUF5107 domain-containing protein n=1 Tax=Maribellus luteus TaxID=2305463 RepID=A0A399SSJ0_9BACT|nr:hypothetical protein [Maribellus luteus]RIJ45462.1 hypothetical protein D1614_23020 [Maribellus luteus]
MKYFLYITLVVLTSVSLSATSQAKEKQGKLTVESMKLGYPVPAIPFYHFIAQLNLPEASIIEVEAAVNGKPMRFVNLYKGDLHEELDKPALTHRPPSGYALSQDNTLYKQPVITGWMKWNPGESYEITLTLRVKKSARPSDDDTFLTATQIVKAPEQAKIFDSAWKNYKSIVLSETAGIDREKEPVEVLLPFYPDEANDLKREIRVLEVDPENFALTEVPCQVFDIQQYTVEDDLEPEKEGQAKRHIPLWMPTVTCKLAFLANVPAKSSKVYLVYYNNEKALAKTWQTDLRVQGELPGLRIDNDYFNAVLHPNSGHLDQLTLKSKPEAPLFHRMETNGAIHWNPGIYVPPRAWTHTADWKHDQNMYSISGPVLATAEFWGNLRDMPEVDASVRYTFYPGVPYFESTTNMRINETVQTIALRNAEIVFKRELMTHAAWYDVIRDEVITYNVANMADLTDLKMEADVPWITFYNENTGIGFAGIQLDYANASLESRSRLLNPYFYITAGPWIYWARALSLSFLGSNMQQVIPAMKGSLFTEKWAYLVYETDKETPYREVLNWQKKLTQPLRVQLVEEVDERVSRSLVEIYMDEGKSGWEERETGKHK